MRYCLWLMSRIWIDSIQILNVGGAWAQIVTPIVCIVWIIIECFRLYLGYAGNLQEKVGERCRRACLFISAALDRFAHDSLLTRFRSMDIRLAGAANSSLLLHDHLSAALPNVLSHRHSTTPAASRHHHWRLHARQYDHRTRTAL